MYFWTTNVYALKLQTASFFYSNSILGVKFGLDSGIKADDTWESNNYFSTFYYFLEVWSKLPPTYWFKSFSN